MKFNEIVNKILSIKEGESLDHWHNAQMDKEEIDPLEDPMFKQAFDILEQLRLNDPDKHAKFVQRLMDLVKFKQGVSL